MEWKTVRNWLLLLVLAADLILAGNMGWQLLRLRREERTAVLDAVAAAESRGVFFDPEMVLAMPRTAGSYRARRSGTEEGAAAEALIPGAQAQEPGGGVVLYTGGGGQISFRRGGALEMTLLGRSASGARDCLELLREAGMPAQGRVVEEHGTTLLQQEYGGRPVFNCRLNWESTEETLSIRGRWLLAEAAETGESALSRGQLVLAACTLLEEQGDSAVTGLEMGYYLLGEDAQSLVLVPAWRLESGSGVWILSALSGRVLNY